MPPSMLCVLHFAANWISLLNVVAFNYNDVMMNYNDAAKTTFTLGYV